MEKNNIMSVLGNIVTIVTVAMLLNSAKAEPAQVQPIRVVYCCEGKTEPKTNVTPEKVQTTNKVETVQKTTEQAKAVQVVNVYKVNYHPNTHTKIDNKVNNHPKK